MIAFEIASLYHFIYDLIKLESYFDIIPQDMIIPSIFYPTPTVLTSSFSTSAFENSFKIYANIFDISSINAYEKTVEIATAIGKNRNKIPIIDDDGNATNKNVRFDSINYKKVDEGVYQLEISWKRYTNYTQEDAALAQEIYFHITLTNS